MLKYATQHVLPATRRYFITLHALHGGPALQRRIVTAIDTGSAIRTFWDREIAAGRGLDVAGQSFEVSQYTDDLAAPAYIGAFQIINPMGQIREVHGDGTQPRRQSVQS